MEEKKTTQQAGAAKPAGRGVNRGGQHGSSSKGGGRRGRRPEAEREFEQKILDLARVTRVTAGGKRMSFRTALLIGDKKGQVALGVAKGADVQISIEKAYRQAKKNLVRVPLVNDTISHGIVMKYGAASVLLKPAPKGTGLKAGGAIRMVLELAGVPNAVSKILNSSNKINLAQATISAIQNLSVKMNSEGHTAQAKVSDAAPSEVVAVPAKIKAPARNASKKTTNT